MSVFRSLAAAVVLALCLAACGDDGPSPRGPVREPSDLEDVGGYPPGAFLVNWDCFAAARDPVFVDGDEADFLAADDPVVGVESAGRVLAIPLQLIAYHRLVDLAWGQRRILVSYAPLQDRLATFEQPKGDVDSGFGVAGHVLRELLLYDKRKRSLWLQETGACISGWRKGETLEKGPEPVRTTWRTWHAQHPMVQVMRPVEGMLDRYPTSLKKPDVPPGLAALPVERKRETNATWLSPAPPPTVDDPQWLDAEAADYVRDHDDVIGFQARTGPVAVPVFVLSHNHAINARFDGEDVLITVCDLCSTGAVYDAVVDGRRLTFDLIGAQYGSALLADRQTRSRWSVVTGACVFGWYRGVTLRARDTRWTHWRAWRADHPRTRVLAQRPVPGDTMALRDGGLRGTPGLPSDMAHTVARRDERLPLNALVLGLSAPPDDAAVPRAYSYDALRAADGVVHDTWGRVPIVVLFDAGTQTAVAYRSSVAGASVVIRRDDKGRFVDDGGTTWNLSGRAVSGPRVGKQLAAIPGRATQAEWYAWAAFHPTTELWGPE